MPAAPIVDKRLHRERLERAWRRRTPAAGFLLDTVTSDLVERLAAVTRRFAVAVVTDPSGRLAAAVASAGQAERVFRLEPAASLLRGDGAPGVAADEEALPLRAESVDLFVSALPLHWANDLPGALVQIRRALRPDGLLLAALAGGATLTELRQSLIQAETELRGGASPRVLPFADVRDLGALLQRAGFALPVADRDVLTVRYDSAYALLADLRAMGGTNALAERDRRPATRRLFRRMAEIYAERFGDADGRIRATVEIVSLSGWAPHDSQQRPAARGSGRVSLADVLPDRSRSGG